MLFDNNGRFLVRAIFWELSPPERRTEIPPLYTLKVTSAHGLPSAYEMYMDSTDEYEAGIKIAGSLKAWRSLCNARWFMEGYPEHGHEGLKQWRLDMEARDKCAAKKLLQKKAEEGNVAAMTKLYNISPKKPDGRVKEVKQNQSPSKIVDIAERMKGK